MATEDIARETWIGSPESQADCFGFSYDALARQSVVLHTFPNFSEGFFNPITSTLTLPSPTASYAEFSITPTAKLADDNSLRHTIITSSILHHVH